MKKIVELPFKVLVQIIVVVRLFFLVVLYSIERMLPGLGIVSRAFDFLSQDKKEHYDIRTRNMISLAFKQVLFKSSRAIITIGAISIAMGTIMLLVSLGYGAQRAIVQRVALEFCSL